jgi:hypothetical protein
MMNRIADLTAFLPCLKPDTPALRQHCTDGDRQRKHQRRQPAAERVVKHEGTPLNPAPAKPARTFLFLTYKNTIKEPKEKGGF